MNPERGSNQSGNNGLGGNNGAQGTQAMQNFTEEDFDAVQESRDIRVNVAAGNISETDMDVCRSSSSNTLAASESSSTSAENERVKFKIQISTPSGVSNGSVNHNHMGPNGHPPVGPPGIGGWGMGGPYGPHSMQAFSKRCASIYFTFSNMSDVPIIIDLSVTARHMGGPGPPGPPGPGMGGPPGPGPHPGPGGPHGPTSFFCHLCSKGYLFNVMKLHLDPKNSILKNKVDFKGIVGQEALRTNYENLVDPQAPGRRREYVDTVLTFKCVVYFPKQKAVANLLKTKTVGQELSSAFGSGELADSSNFSHPPDVTLIVGEKDDKRELKCHKFILSLRSKVFNAMFMHNTRERKTGRVEIPDADPDIYKQMIEFMYTDKVASPNMELLQVAHKYEIHGLQILCEKDLAEKLATDNILQTLRVSHVLDCAHLKNKAMEFVLKYWDDLKGTGCFETLWKEVPSLATEMVSLQFQENKTLKTKLSANTKK